MLIKLHFGIKTLLVTVFLLAVCVAVAKHALSDTIFRSEDQGLIELPNGAIYPLNRWFFSGETIDLDLLATDAKGEYLLVSRNNPANITTIETCDGLYEAVVTRFKFHGPKYKGEFWIRRGNVVGAETTGTTRPPSDELAR